MAKLKDSCKKMSRTLTPAQLLCIVPYGHTSVMTGGVGVDELLEITVIVEHEEVNRVGREDA